MDNGEISDAVRDAISQVLAENGYMLQAFVGQVDYLMNDGEPAYAIIAGRDQASYDTWTMTQNLALWYDEARRQDIREGFDDD